MASVSATSGVREPVASTAAVMIARDGTLNHNTLRRWVVMQTYSQTVDKTVTLGDLPGLASRLSLPTGWRYEARTPAEPLRVDTTGRDACVTQDDLGNSYSLQVLP